MLDCGVTDRMAQRQAVLRERPLHLTEGTVVSSRLCLPYPSHNRLATVYLIIGALVGLRAAVRH